MLQPVMMNIRESDIRRVRISCRCGEVSVVEVPQQLLAGKTMHPCKCGVIYTITRPVGGNYEIRREGDVAGSSFLKVEDKKIDITH